MRCATIMQVTMPSITVKNIPHALHEGLKHAAMRNRRSLQSEILVCLELAIEQTSRSKTELLTVAEELREKLPWVDHDLIDQIKRSGRP